jgi:hypothetical protein
MPNFEQEEYKFPDEIDDKDDVVNLDEGGKAEVEDKGFDIEVEDDTPEQDRNAVPLDKDTVKELEEDDLKDYSKKVKQRIDQMKKVWHDERRAKEAALREQQEAVRVAQQLLEENKKLKEAYSSGEKTYIEVAQGAAESQLQLAKRSYKEALDSGDSDAIADAQVALNEATYKSQQTKNFKPTTLQADEKDVQIPQSTYKEQPKVDPTTQKWLDKNTWYGADEEMTALALAVHSKLENNFGKQFVGSEDYFKRIDDTIRKRFPENFSDEIEVQTQTGGGKPSQRTEAKSAPVVAPATRSTASKRIVLKATQVALAKKLGLSPEQYARELQKLEG